MRSVCYESSQAKGPAASSPTHSSYFTAIVTLFERKPTIVKTTSTAFPVGAGPENDTVAGTPPMVSVGLMTDSESGVDGAGAPVAGWLVTAPRPVQKMEM